MRQGCPLSPLLFAIAIEPLSIALKALPHYQGITRHGVEHRVSLYADDLLLYITNPVPSIPLIQSVLRNFGSFSGYKLNFHKSECFPINALAQIIPQSSIPFNLSRQGFKYLGIKITHKLNSLFEANFTPLVAKMKSDFQSWSSLPLSLSGKVQCVKMNILPKFLYVFICLPVFLPKSFFCTLDWEITTFICGGKVPRISKAVLQKPRNRGGLALPNFMHYYWAANIHKLVYWLKNPDADWCNLEAQSCHSSSLSALVFSSLPLSPSCHSLNPLVQSTLKIWIQFRRHFKFSSASFLGPIGNNHLFAPSILDSTFTLWARLGLNSFKDLFDGGIFPSFNTLCLKFNLPRTNFFRYLQVRNFVRTESDSFPGLPQELRWESLF